jgi:hypothetical protein
MSPIIEGTGLDKPLENAGTPVNGTNEVQTITDNDTATQGTFRVCFEGFRTTLLTFDVSAADMQTALRLLPSIGAAGVGVARSGPAYVWTLSFAGNLQRLNVPPVTIEDNTCKTAGAVAIVKASATTVAGVTATGRGCAPGALLIDTTNGALYLNAGSALAPSWAVSTLAKLSVVVHNADGAIAVPTGNQAIVLTKATAAAMTLVAPTAGTHDGVTLNIVSTTAVAHTVTQTTPGFNNGGAASDVATFGAAIGNCMEIIAYNGVWLVLALRNVTLA